MHLALCPGLCNELARGLRGTTSYNLIGPSGSGRMRLLQDLKAELSNECKVAVVDLRDYKGHYEGFVWEVARQLGAKDCKHLGDVANYVHALGKQKVILLLANFDAILGTVAKAPRCESQFLGELNNLKNLDNTNLAVVSTKYFLDYTMSQEKDWTTLSQLSLTRREIPPYTTAEAQAEILRQAPGLDAPTVELLSHNYLRPYETLIGILDRIQREGMPEDGLKTFRKWKKELERHAANSTSRQMVKLNRWMEKWKGLGKPIWYLIGVGSGSAVVAFGKWIWEFLKPYFN